MFYFPEVPKRFWVGGAREGRGLKWVGRDTANNFLWTAYWFFGMDQNSVTRFNPHRLCRKSRSLLGYADVSASIVSLKRLIVSKTFLMRKQTKLFVRPAKTQISLGIRCPHEESFVPYLPTQLNWTGITFTVDAISLLH